MEKLFSMIEGSIPKFLTSINYWPYTVHISLLVILIILLCILSIIYSKIRRKSLVKVNCWFCCKDCKVHYNLLNKWNCPNCKQYNGFDENGDYNKIIEEQYNLNLNNKVYSNLKKFNSNLLGNDKIKSNRFCQACNINQQLKIQQWALFVPINEKNYDEEIKEYKQKLEKAYKLCASCEEILKKTLEKQEYYFSQSELNSKIQKPLDIKNYNDISILQEKSKILSIMCKKFESTIKLIFLFYYVLLFSSLFMKWSEENSFRVMLSFTPVLQELEQILMVMPYLMKEVYKNGKGISFCTFLIQLLFNFQKEWNELLVVLFMGLLHVSFWTCFTGLQLIFCGVAIYLICRKSRLKKTYCFKKAPNKKFIFKPSEQYFCKESKTSFDDSLSKLWFTSLKQYKVKNPDQKQHNQVQDQDKKKNDLKKSKVNLNFKPKMANDILGNDKKSKNEGDIMENELYKKINSLNGPKNNIQHSSVFNKSFLTSLEKNKEAGKFNSGLDEVYNNLSELSIGKKEERRRNKSNFLFEKHNFLNKSSLGSTSIIKPPKLVKNLSNSWTYSESNESDSRSSTPSSGYSSVKPDHFEVTKSSSAFTANSFLKRDYFDYWNANRFCNFNCYPYEFLPFQQFPGPTGHAAVYTYTRPTNTPFTFLAPRFPYFKSFETITPHYPECDNIFQKASKSFQNNKRWFKIKNFLYFFSVFLNCLTFLCMFCLFSMGVVSIDWNLPMLNLFA